MATETDQLIRRLTENSPPVRPLASPWTRALGWFALAVPYVALVVAVMGPRGDLFAKLAEWRFVIEQTAALTTSIAAAVAAFATIIPGYNRKILVVPMMPLALWLASLGQGCIQSWLQFGMEGLSLRPDWICLPAIALTGSVPAIAMVVMLRRGAPLTPHLTVALGALAAAGLGNFGLRLFHPQDASLMVLVWQFGSVFALSAAAGWAGRLVLNWDNVIAELRRV